MIRNLQGNKIVFAILALSGWVMSDTISWLFALPGIFPALLNQIFFMGLVIVMFRGDREKKILAASMLITAVTLVGNFCVAFLTCLTLFWEHTVKKIPVPFLNGWESDVIYCISLVIVAGTVYGMAKYAAPVFYCRTKRWYLTLSVPLLAVTAVVDVANWGASSGILVRSGGNMGLYYDQIFSHLGFCVLTALAMFASGFYVFGMNRIYLEEQKSSQYHSQVAAYRMLEEQYGQLERLRHDMKNHLIALSGLLENKEWDKMNAYLDKMRDSSGMEADGETTGNRVVDVLLYQKQKLAESKNILWECDVQMPKECCISEFDLCVLFGNILDNAVEACERQKGAHSGGKSGLACRKFINVQAKSVKKCFLLEVKNSTDLKEIHKAGLSVKDSTGKHGIGLLNVRDMVQSYQGAMSTEIREGVFIITVLIPQSDAVHDMKQVI